MKTPPHMDPVSLERRQRLLESIPGFAAMPAALLKQLAARLDEEHYPMGAVVIAEGEVGDRLFIIEDGEAEVTTAGAREAVSLALLEPGDMFGEIALLAPTHHREATVTAVTPVMTLSVPADVFERALQACPDSRGEFAALTDTLLSAKFLKQQHSWREAWEG